MFGIFVCAEFELWPRPTHFWIVTLQTLPRLLGRLKRVQSELVDVEIEGEGEVLADGRTTPVDVTNRDITLGFHENCHQRDFVAYLSAHPLPEPPAMSLGMMAADYDVDVKRFFREFGDYAAAMRSDSEANTDEVGRRKADVASRGCFVHYVP